MTDDLLERATRALRESSAEPNPRSGLTRARMLDSAEKRYTARRGYGLRWIIAIATVFAASTALARVAQYWPEIKRALAPAADHAEPEAAPKRNAVRPRHVAKPVATPQPTAAGAAAPPTAAPVEVVVAPEPAAAPAEPPLPLPRRAPARPKPAPPLQPAPAPAAVPAPAPVETPAPVPAAAPPVESAELALFRRAQRLHRARDPRALAAWDDYLRVADRGALVPEARYNRALVLVRLRRKADAKAALEPFARGEYGSYRRSEAAALLDALDR